MDNWRLKPANDFDLPLQAQISSVHREGGLINAISIFAWSVLVTIYLKLYHRLRVEGRQNLPACESFVLVSNHCSHLDEIVLASIVPWRMKSRLYPIAAGDTFFSSSVKGIFSTLFLNALPMWRSKRCSHALADLRGRLLNEKCVYILFPEGTRSRTGAMGQFKPGLGMIVASTSTPVVPCKLTGTFAALPPHRKFPRPVQITLIIGASQRFENLNADRQGWQDVASAMQGAVSDLSV